MELNNSTEHNIWFYYFIENSLIHTMTVKLSGVKSDLLNITAGVSQGSTLGPLFCFSIHKQYCD